MKITPDLEDTLIKLIVLFKSRSRRNALNKSNLKKKEFLENQEIKEKKHTVSKETGSEVFKVSKREPS